MTEIIRNSDPRAHGKDMIKAKTKEVDDLIR